MGCKRFLIAAVLLLTACQFGTSIPPASTPTLPPSPLPTPTVTETVSSALQIEMNGVSLKLWRPAGWEAGDNDRGIIIAEYTIPASGGTVTTGGMLIYCSVALPDSDNNGNRALAALQQIVGHVGNKNWDATMTQPTALKWDGNDAAYYLFTSGDGVRALVIAVAVPGQNVVFCTISAPMMQAGRIRAQLGQLLDGMTINMTTLHGSGLNALPDPLPFPRYVPPPSTPQATAPSSIQTTAQP